MPRKKPIVLDSSGDEVKCYTVREAAKELGMTLPEIKLVMFKKSRNLLPYYRLMGKAKKRRVIRITSKDLEAFRTSRNIFDGIADKIVQARKEMTVIRTGATLKEFGKDIGLTPETLCRVERKKLRISIKKLEKIAKVTGKELEWFLE
jgi:transcriptional regulator with XRE-family HTH domain